MRLGATAHRVPRVLLHAAASLAVCRCPPSLRPSAAAAAVLQVRLSHRVAELENLPYGLSAKPHVLKVGVAVGSEHVPLATHVSTRCAPCVTAQGCS